MYKLIVDNGKPCEEIINTDDELHERLHELKILADDDYLLDVKVFNEKDEDITETQFVQELIDNS